MDKNKEKTILIVEDDENSYLYLLFALEETGSNILRASNGIEAINIFKEAKVNIDLILMDLKLPLIDGYQCSEAIRRIKPNVTIIAQTASYLPLIDQKLKEYNFDGVIIKPFTVTQLFEAIESVDKNRFNSLNNTSEITLLHDN